jgi:hypothetical protein
MAQSRKSSTAKKKKASPRKRAKPIPKKPAVAATEPVEVHEQPELDPAPIPEPDVYFRPEPEPRPEPDPAIFPPAGKSGGGFGRFLILILVLAAISGGGYATWPQWSPYVAAYIPPALMGKKYEDPAVTGLAGRIAVLEEQGESRQADTGAIAELEAERARLRDEVTHLMARLESVEQAVGAVKQMVKATSSGGDMADANQTLQQLTDHLEKLEENGDTIDGLKQRISQLESHGSDGQTSPAPETVAVNQRLADAVTEFEIRLNELETNQRTGGEPPAAAATVLAVGQLRKTVQSGDPFVRDLEALKSIAGGDTASQAAASVLDQHAVSGIESLSVLRERLGSIAGEIVQAAKTPSGSGWVDRTWRTVAKLVNWRRIDGDPESVDTDVARAEAKLQAGDLVAAIEEIERLGGLSEQAAAAAAPWLNDAKARMLVEQAMATLHIYAVTLLAPANE